MVNPHREMRYQRTLDVPHHLLRSELCRRQYVYLIDRPAVTRNYPRRNYPWKRQYQLLGPLDGEYTARNR